MYVECIEQSIDRKCTDRHDSDDELQGASARDSSNLPRNLTLISKPDLNSYYINDL